MELDQLRHLTKVAEHGNFTRAAAELNLTQPAISRSIARLEEELGQPLFERHSRQVVLTDAGQAVLVTARQILGMIDDLKARIADDGETGRVRVGAIPTIAPYFLPGLIRRFRDDHPRAQVCVVEETTDKLLQKLSDGEIDVAVLARPLNVKYLEVEDLFDEELLLVMPASSELCDEPVIRLERIESMPFVLLGEAHCLTDNIVHFCRNNAFNPVALERTSQLATVQELVALGHGVSLVPEMARLMDTSDRRVYRRLAGTTPTRRIVMAWNAYRFRSRLVEAFRALVRDSAHGKIEVK
jgi:LysR family hydrogen peroxide-inducible transcriptional activator